MLELAQSWVCRARGNGPEARKHWHFRKKSQQIKVWILNNEMGGFEPPSTSLFRTVLHV